MEFGNAFTYMFSSKDWIRKIVLAIALYLTPVLGSIVLIGWALDVQRNLTLGKEDPLPEWTGDDFTRWLGRGLGLTVALITYLLPVIAVVSVMLVIGFLVSLVASMSLDEVGGYLNLCFACIGFILAIVAGLGAQVVFVRYARTDKIGVGLDYAKTFQTASANIAPLIVITLLMLAVGLASGILSALTLGIFGLVAPVYSILIMAYFGSELARRPGFAE